jgi:hypothetical protein
MVIFSAEFHALFLHGEVEYGVPKHDVLVCPIRRENTETSGELARQYAHHPRKHLQSSLNLLNVFFDGYLVW